MGSAQPDDGGLRRRAPVAYIILVLLGEAEEADDAPPVQFAGRAEAVRGPFHAVAERISAVVVKSPVDTEGPSRPRLRTAVD